MNLTDLVRYRPTGLDLMTTDDDGPWVRYGAVEHLLSQQPPAAASSAELPSFEDWYRNWLLHKPAHTDGKENLRAAWDAALSTASTAPEGERIFCNGEETKRMGEWLLSKTAQQMDWLQTNFYCVTMDFYEGRRYFYIRGLPGAWSYLADAIDATLATHPTSAVNQASAAQGEVAGLSVAQEPKYTVNGSAIVNRASGEAIPADEPVFIFRARDRHAIKVLAFYADKFCRDEHYAAVRKRIKHFRQFQSRHPGRMKEPDTHPAPPASASTESRVEEALQAAKRYRELGGISAYEGLIAAINRIAVSHPVASDSEPVLTKGTTAITDAWNALPDKLRLDPHLCRLFDAVKTCRDVDATPAPPPAPEGEARDA